MTGSPESSAHTLKVIIAVLVWDSRGASDLKQSFETHVVCMFVLI